MMIDSKISFKKFEIEFQKFKQNNITFQHRLIDDMVACIMKWSGGFFGLVKTMMGMLCQI